MTLDATPEMLRRIEALRLQEPPALSAMEWLAESTRLETVHRQSQIWNFFQDAVKSTSLAASLSPVPRTTEIMQSLVESARRPTVGGLPTPTVLQDLNIAENLMDYFRRESAVTKAMRSAADSTHQASVRQQSQIANIAESFATSASFTERMTQESPTLEIMQSIVESARRSALEGLGEPKMLRNLNRAASLLDHVRQESSARKAMQSIVESAGQAVVRRQSTFSNMIQAIASSTKLADSLLQESNAMTALRQMSNLSLSSIVREMSISGLPVPDTDHTELGSYSGPDFSFDQEVELEVQGELEGSNNFDLLSGRAKLYIGKFFLHILLPLIVGLLSNVVSDTRLLQQVLMEYKTPKEMNSYMRKGNHDIEKELLKGYRVVTGLGVRLRRTPSMKSEIIALLPLGTLVEVLNESNRSWLQGEVDVEGERVVGWISRLYTKKFN